MAVLENLRDKFTDVHKDFDKLLAQHPHLAAEAIDAAEDAAGKAYINNDGHHKMEFAIAYVLEQIHIPGPFAVMASQQIVDRTEAFVQAKYNEQKAKEAKA